MIRPRTPSTAALAAAVLAFGLCAGCSSEASEGALSAAPSTAPPSPVLTTSTSDTASSDGPQSGPSPSLTPVPPAELTGFRIQRGNTVLIVAQSSGLARYRESPTCEVPGKPCYDAPFLDKVARIDVGAPPQVPGTETTFITGHANRYQPDDPTRGVFSHLQDVHIGDSMVLTTSAGVFEYAVTKTLKVPFDQLTTNPDVVTVRPDTAVAIGCEIPSDRGPYLGNVVVIGALRSSTPS